MFGTYLLCFIAFEYPAFGVQMPNQKYPRYLKKFRDCFDNIAFPDAIIKAIRDIVAKALFTISLLILKKGIGEEIIRDWM